MLFFLMWQKRVDHFAMERSQSGISFTCEQGKPEMEWSDYISLFGQYEKLHSSTY